VKIPQDIRLIGIDDVKISQMTSIPLTSVYQPCRAIGSAAVHTMIRRIENQKMCAHDIFVDVEVVVRDSCGASLGHAPQLPE
jgi:DNA-binding LacI/PurR family transcriptional regulator